jgi:ElaB/YqjD/DUF883 family membrane-anchored ribosome-binding protein
MQDRHNGHEPGQPGETRLKETVVGTIDEVKERVANVTRAADDKLDARREPAARTLQKTAERLEETANRVTSVVSGAARKLNATADYIREHDVREMRDDVQNLVRRHPVPALAAAAVVGYLVGRAFRRSD